MLSSGDKTSIGGVLRFNRLVCNFLCVRLCVCVCKTRSLSNDTQWQLPVNPSRNATLQTCHPTPSDPPYYGCLHVTLHKCLRLSGPVSVSVAVSLLLYSFSQTLCLFLNHSFNLYICRFLLPASLLKSFV